MVRKCTSVRLNVNFLLEKWMKVFFQIYPYILGPFVKSNEESKNVLLMALKLIIPNITITLFWSARQVSSSIMIRELWLWCLTQFSTRVWRYQREVIRIRKSKKNRQHNGQKKKYNRTNNDLQNIHIKLKIE
jgi:hypothetical protein